LPNVVKLQYPTPDTMQKQQQIGDGAVKASRIISLVLLLVCAALAITAQLG
jgi:hypothetical protein